MSGGAISSGTLPGGALSDATIGSGKLNVGSLAANGSSFRRQFDTIYADEARVKSLIANSIKVNDLKFGTIHFANGGTITGTEVYDGYNVLKVNGLIETTGTMIADAGLTANSWVHIHGALTAKSFELYNNSKYGIGSNGVATFLTTKTTHLFLIRNGINKTVQVAATAGNVPANAKVLYIT